MTNTNLSSRVIVEDWLKIALVAALLAGIYYSTLVWLEAKDWGRADYSYGYVIPLVALYLIWEKRRELRELPSVPSWAGYLALVSGLALFWIGELSGEFFSLYASFWLVIVGLFWTQLGWAKLKTIAFPLVILLSMFPPPNFIHTKISLQLKLISSKIGVWVLQAFGMSAFREGNVIDLGFTELQVVDACSGLRYLFPLLIMGLLLAYFYKAALWKKVLLVVSTVPLTIIINSLRIAATGVLFRVWGPEVAEGFFHGFSGWLIFIFALAVLLVEIWVLKAIGQKTEIRFHAKTPRREEEQDKESVSSQKQNTGDRRQETGDRRDATTQRPNDSTTLGRKDAFSALNAMNAVNARNPINSFSTLRLKDATTQRHFFAPSRFVVAVIMLAGTLALAQGVEFREKIPASKPFSQFPLTVGAWEGTRQSMEQKFIDTLDLSDYTIVDYVGTHGKGVNFYVAYYESQRKGESIHSPETCLPGSGWAFEGAGRAAVDPGNGRMPMPVNRALMEKAGQRQLSYFWFPMRGRVLTNAYQLKIYTFWDALTRQRTDGALVRLVTPIYEREEVADAEQRLQAFTRDIIPVLDQFIPK
jgi:EpsI family protein